MFRSIRTAIKERLRAHWMTGIGQVLAQRDEGLRQQFEQHDAALADIGQVLVQRDEGLRQQIEQHDAALAQRLRSEYTIMPRFAYHQPLDYHQDTLPPSFDPAVIVDGERLPLPPVPMRMGYPADDKIYLEMGRLDHALILSIIKEFSKTTAPLDVLDLGCSTGRVLRFFDDERQERGWRLYGADIQALTIEWLRHNFPSDYCVFTCSVMPHLPLPDNSVDVIYGISVFTHIKYLWDAWLMELRRVLKPGGLLIQTIHTENAWRFYHEHREVEWVKAAHSASMLQTRDMSPDYFYYGDIATSQVFWKREIARKFWSRYFDVLDVRPPPPRYSFQDWVICRKGLE